MCILLLFTVAILDVVVAWALYILLVAADKNLSAFAAWLRVIYAGIFIFAISKLYVALQVITADGTQTMSFLKSFQSIWELNFIFAIQPASEAVLWTDRGIINIPAPLFANIASLSSHRQTHRKRRTS